MLYVPKLMYPLAIVWEVKVVSETNPAAVIAPRPAVPRFAPKLALVPLMLARRLLRAAPVGTGLS